MRTILFIFFFFSAAVIVYAEGIDSLLQLSLKYQNINLDSAVSFALKAKEMAYEMEKRELEIEAINLLATAFAYKGEITKFEELSTHSLFLCKKYKLNDKKIFALLDQSFRYRELHQTSRTIRKIQIATNEVQLLPKEERILFYPELYEAIGYLLYYELKDSIVSLEYLHKAHNYFLQRGDTNNYNNLFLHMGEIFRLNGRSDRAANYYMHAKEAAIESQDSNILGKYYRLKSATYLDRDNVARALQLLREAEVIFTNLNNIKQLSDLYSMFAYAYSYVEDNRMSLEYNSKSLQLRKQLGNVSLVASSYINVANSYNKLGIPDSSLLFVKKAYNICTKIGHNFYLQKSLKKLSELYSEQGNKKSAYFYLSQYQKLRDSLENTRTSLFSLLEEKIRYSMLETDMYERDRNSELELNNYTLRMYLYISIFVILLLSIIAIRLYLNIKKAKRHFYS